MQQMDIFDETLSKKICRMEKWITRLQKEVWFLKEVYNMTQRQHNLPKMPQLIEQKDMFGT